MTKKNKDVVERRTKEELESEREYRDRLNQIVRDEAGKIISIRGKLVQS